MVPNGWEQIRLNDVTEFITSGSRDWAQFYSDSGSKFVRMTNLSRDSIYLKLDNMKYVDVSSKSADGKRTSLSAGDVLMSITAELGKIGWIPENFGEAYINQHTALIRLNDKRANSQYIAYLLSSKAMNHRINKLNDSGAKAGLNLPTIRSIHINLPPLPEQRKIAQILSTWDRGIATTEKLIDASKQQKKALMQQLLTGKKRLVDPETGKKFEGEWERHSLSDLVYVDRKSLGKKTPDNFKFKYISLSNVDFGIISKELEVHEFSAAPSRARRVLQDGDILMSTVRPNLKGFAKVTSCYADCIASTGFAVLTPKKKVNGDYIYQYIFSAHVTGQIDSLVVGSNYPAINSSDVSGLKVYCPTFEEQQKIASVLTAADKEIELLNAKLSHFKQEKKALMQQLLTGKRRVQVEAA